MMDYWKKQQPNQPLFEKILWSKPERRDQAGRLAIIGGSSSGFSVVANSYSWAVRFGIGENRVVMPDSLTNKIPSAIRHQIDDLIFAPANYSGGFAINAEKELLAAALWSNNLLFIGDSGANSETAQLLSRLLTDQKAVESTMTICRDAIDLIIYNAEDALKRTNTNLIVSLSQLQKIARAVYYPRMISFSQGLNQMVETLHKFTITYPATITVYHDSNLLVSQGGRVISQSFDQPIRLWSGELPTKIAVWSVWCNDLLSATATAWINE